MYLSVLGNSLVSYLWFSVSAQLWYTFGHHHKCITYSWCFCFDISI